MFNLKIPLPLLRYITCFIVSLLLFLSVQIQSQARPDNSQNKPASLTTAHLNSALKNKLANTGRIRVIVLLKNQQLTAVSKHKSAIALTTQIQTSFARSLNNNKSKIIAKTKLLPLVVLEVDSAGFSELLSHPDVIAIEEDRLISPLLTSSIPLIEADSVHASGITGNNQTIAIIDSGVDASHSFLSGKIVAEACFSSDYAPHSATSICPFADIYAAGSAAPCQINGCDHGTHVSGIAAGNGSSITGVAKDASLIAIQVFSQFSDSASCGSAATTPCILAYTSDIIAGLEYVYTLRNTYNIAAANLSLGGGGYTSMAACDASNSTTKSIIDLLRSVNIATVISSGNDGNDTAINSPGCISSAISVGSTTDGDSLSGFSNAASWLSLLAPGSSIISSVPGNAFQSKSGTSMAAPHVTGAFALLAQAQTSSSLTQRLASLTLSGLPITLPDSGFIKPRINLSDAITTLQSSAIEPVDLIMDNDYTGSIISGTFSNQNNNFAFAGRQFISTNSASSFRFTPNIDVSGAYEIYAWWANEPGANRALFNINHALGLSSIEINQSTAGGNWFLIGNFLLDAGSSNVIDISASLSSVAVDAVRLKLTALPPLTITTSFLANAQVSSDYQQSLSASGGLAPYSWSLIDTLPAGLNLSQQGIISGISETAGTFQFNVQVSDQLATTVSKSLSLEISPLSSVTEIIIDNTDTNTSSIGDWLASGGASPWGSGSVYSNDNGSFSWLANISSSGTYQVYAWWTYYSTRSNSVPYNIQHDAANTIISVNQQDPALAAQWVLLGSFDFTAGGTYPIQVSSSNGQASADAIKLVSNNARPQTLAIETLTLPYGQAGLNYDLTLAAGGGQPPYIWSSTSSFPPGLTLNTSGVLSGIPLAAGSWDIQLEVSDQAANNHQADFTLVIGAADPLIIDPSQLPDAEINLAYTRQMSATGGMPPYNWANLTPLPPGLSLAADGQLTGTPSQTGFWNFDIQLTDVLLTSTQISLSIEVFAAPPVSSEIIIDNKDSNISFTGSWVSSSGPNPWAGNSIYSNSNATFRWPPDITASDTDQVYAWWTYHANRSHQVPYTISHSSGLTTVEVAQNNSSLAGQWHLLGQFDLLSFGDNYIEISSQNGQASADAVKFVATGPAELEIITSVLPEGAVGTSYQATLAAAGGEAPYSWSITGVFPPGLILEAAGMITGTPETGGTFNFTLEVSDQQNYQSTAALSITITTPAPLIINTNTLPDAQTNESYLTQLTATGGFPPYFWTLSGNLPSGLILASSGIISGQPELSGNWDFDISVTDQQSGSVQSSLSIEVFEPITTVEIFIDNQDTNTGQSGSWTTSSGPLPWQGNSVYSNSSAVFSWYPQILTSGDYQVYAWWTYHNNRSDSVPYTISHDNGSSQILVDQHNSSLGGQWVLLGAFTFTLGGNYAIEISSENGQASADAVRLVKITN